MLKEEKNMKNIKKIIYMIILLIIFIFPTTTVNAAVPEKIEVVYFYSERCLACKENSNFIKNLQNNNKIEVKKYDVEKDKDYQNLQLEYSKAYGVDKERYLTVPTVFVGDKYFIVDNDETRNKINSLISNYLNGSVKYKPIKVLGSNESINNFFNDVIKNSSYLGILGAGLLDGINPCAISILLVFCSFMTFSKKRKQAIIASICFIVGIFTANFTYGIGITYFYKIFSGNQYIISILYIIAILICIFAVIVNTKDVYNQTHNKGEIKNQLPNSWKYKMSEMAQKSVFSKFIVIVTIITGFLIGIIELACTGQIYYPTITYMINNDSMNPYYMFLLISYNIMFILPLIIIAVIGIILKDPEKIKKHIMKHTYIIKIISNLFFVFMAYLLVKELVNII